jgi:TetR/AcrR family transcriptional regulator, cholesterol catabolism regulator
METFLDSEVSVLSLLSNEHKLILIESKILGKSEELFMQLGVKRVTMDDIASALSMSKKTLYQYFDNKDSLVLAVAKAHIERETLNFLEIKKTSMNSIEEMHRLAKDMRKNLGQINPSILFDLQRFHPQAWDCFLKFNNEFIQGMMEENLDRGIKEGYYRLGLDSKILAKIRVEQIRFLCDEKIFPNSTFEFSRVQVQILDHYIQGLLTELGRKLYIQFQENERN